MGIKAVGHDLIEGIKSGAPVKLAPHFLCRKMLCLKNPGETLSRIINPGMPGKNRSTHFSGNKFAPLKLGVYSHIC